MKIKDKILLDRKGLEKEGPINIVVFGDSVTHGALCGCFNYETVYWNLLRQKICAIRDYVPVNVINAGIGGTTAKSSLRRLESQVLSHSPDLIIVCFGLNDINGTLEDYLSALEIIFKKCKEQCETVFLTPNMLNTYVAEDTPKEHIEYAKKTAEYQTSGRMDLYIHSATKLARDIGVEVCDCYSMWKELSKTEDTTKLLINRINHPTQEMHKLFADALFETIFKGADMCKSKNSETAMYQNERN